MCWNTTLWLRYDCLMNDTASIPIKLFFSLDFVASYISCPNSLIPWLNPNCGVTLLVWEDTITLLFGPFFIWTSNSADSIYLSESLSFWDFFFPFETVIQSCCSIYRIRYYVVFGRFPIYSKVWYYFRWYSNICTSIACAVIICAYINLVCIIIIKC